jgi:hypothetical protein
MPDGGVIHVTARWAASTPRDRDMALQQLNRAVDMGFVATDYSNQY